MRTRIYLLLLAITAIFFSCKDKTNEFAEQLFTNTQISNALKECIRISVQTTANTLCVVDSVDQKLGYFWYQDSTYRLILPPAVKTVVDTLTVYGYENQMDTLIINMNRAAEKCGEKIVLFWKPIIEDIVFPYPNKLLHGGNKAITNYVKDKNQSVFLSELVTNILKEQFGALNVVSTWNELQQNYFEITGVYSSFDLLAYTAQQMADSYFIMMAITEEAIRKDPDLRGDKNGWLYQVFATL
jgi:hypothetical protein